MSEITNHSHHPTFYDECYNSSLLGIKLIHVSKSRPDIWMPGGCLMYHTGRCRCEIVHPYDSRYTYIWDYLALDILCKMKDEVTSGLYTKITNSVDFWSIEIKQTRECKVYNWLYCYAIQVLVPSHAVLQLHQRKQSILRKVGYKASIIQYERHGMDR